MTEVAFHFNAADKTAYAARLLRKAYLKGARVQVLTEPRAAAALDQLLWTMAAVEFIPHCLDSDTPLVKGASPILINPGAVDTGFAADVLLNLKDQLPAGFERFARVIEVVTADEADREGARERWRGYKVAGLAPLRHDLKGPGADA
jgi:DNA polymerase-3 subunit chi